MRSQPSGRRPREASFDEASFLREKKRTRIPLISSDPTAATRSFSMLMLVLGVMVAAAALRLFYLQVIDAPALKSAAQARQTNTVVLQAKRGTIYDRNGSVLAMSVDATTIVANPREITKKSETADLLASYLGGDAQSYEEQLDKDTTFVYVQRQVDTTVADKLKEALSEADLGGIYYYADTKRVYPYGNTGIQIIGLLNNDGKGISGIEKYYNDQLTGQDGTMTLETGRTGTPIAGGISETVDAVDGQDIVLSIDINLQAKVEELVSSADETYSSDATMVSVMNPSNGEMLAAASSPLPDITDRSQLDVSSLNLRAVSDAYEPGSVFKVVTTSLALQTGNVTANSVYNVPWRVKVGDSYVKDSDGRTTNLDMTVAEMIRRSSNTGMVTLMRDALGEEAFADGVEAFGIGAATGVDFPGESTGIVKSYGQYDGSTAGNMAFGQGLSVSMLQMARAVCAVANRGTLITPHFAQSVGGTNVSWATTQAPIDAQSATSMAEMMRAVITSGDAKRAAIEGYDIVGKTGTAQMADDKGGYIEGKNYSSLCGFINEDNPELLVYTGCIGTPLYSYTSAAPLFHDVMSAAIQTFGITPNQ